MAVYDDPIPEEIPALLSEVEPIEQGGVPVVTRESLKDIVELPLLSACQELYDKNIQTSMTSANKKDVESGEAYIIVYYDTLSDENKIVADQLGETYEYRKTKLTKMTIPVTAHSTVAEINEKALEIAHQFKTQPMSWVPRYSLRELKKAVLLTEDAEGGPEMFPHYFYDSESELFFMSEEHFRKAKESGAI